VGRKLGKRERTDERILQKTFEQEWSAIVTKIGLSAKREIGRSRSAHVLWSYSAICKH